VIALSPDGRYLVFTGLRDGQRQLYLRAMDRLEATAMPGTENGVGPFFSPDGQWVGFWQPTGTGLAGELKKVPVHGGSVVTICQTPLLWGVSWGSHGRIVFTNGAAVGLWQVSDGGGTPQPLTSLDATKGEASHRLPHVLPGGEAVLFTILKTRRFDDVQVVVQSLKTGERKVLAEGGVDARYASSGHLIYARLGTLMAVPFDLARLEVTGPEIGVLDDVMQDVNSGQANANTGTAQFSLSNTGTLAYLPGGINPGERTSSVWVDRTGLAKPFQKLARADLVGGRVSPDGQRAVFFTLQGVLPHQSANIWVADLAWGTLSSLPTPGDVRVPRWTPDGQRIVFASVVNGRSNLFWLPSDGSGSPTRLTTSDSNQYPSSWSSDGKTLAFTQSGAGTPDIWVLSVGSDPPTAQPFLATQADERYPEFSPDGRWLAYVSNESGRDEVYVRPYPGPGPRHVVPTNRGTQPAWTQNGRELVYTEPSGGTLRMMAVDVTTGTTFTARQPRLLFEGPYLSGTPVRGYDVSPDGKRFLMPRRDDTAPEPPITQIILVQHWLEDVKRLALAK
jgi:serine/threonine-protein kinase